MQCMSRLIEPVKSFHRRYWDADWFQSIVMHGIVYATASDLILSANKIAVLLFDFPPVAILIPNQFRCVISRKKLRKQISAQIYNLLFFSRFNTLRV